MTLLLLDIPDDPTQLAGWLERMLVSRELGDLAAELHAIDAAARPERPTRGESLEDVCGPALPQLLDNGMQALPVETLRSLLKQPRLLLDLQELILADGGEYWQKVEITPEHQAAVERGWIVLQAQLRGVGEPPAGGGELMQKVEPAGNAIFAEPRPLGSGRPKPLPDGRGSARKRLVDDHAKYNRRWAALAIAAALLMGVGLWFQRPAASPGWGWDRPGALVAELPAADYLNHLADGADEWFRKRPDSRVALEKRLQEFRHGCDALIAAPHSQLAAKDRDWLKERCRAWAGKLEGHVADLQAGRDVSTVLAAADGTVRKLIDALRERAKSV